MRKLLHAYLENKNMMYSSIIFKDKILCLIWKLSSNVLFQKKRFCSQMKKNGQYICMLFSLSLLLSQIQGWTLLGDCKAEQQPRLALLLQPQNRVSCCDLVYPASVSQAERSHPRTLLPPESGHLSSATLAPEHGAGAGLLNQAK